MALSDLSDHAAVVRAIDEFDEVGREEFLNKHGYGPARQYWLIHNGRRYDSKAIAGVAHGYQFPEKGPLQPSEFSGGEATVRQRLEELGFVVDGSEGESVKDLPTLLSDVLTLLAEREAGDTRFDPERLRVLVENEAPATVAKLVGDRYQTRGRTGIGTPADVPWVGIFPPGSERSAQQGFYAVLLFAKDGSSVYLSLNQGTEQLRHAKKALGKRVLDMRRVLNVEDDRLVESINLQSENERPRRYEAGNAYAFRYEAGAVPSNAELGADLQRMTQLLDELTDSGLQWHPEIEPMHLVFKWNADREPQTIERHRVIAEREGSVWWGRFSASTTRSVAKSKLEDLQRQLDSGLETFAFLYRRGSLWRSRVEEVTVDPPDGADPRFPTYYRPSDCNLFVRLTSFEELEPDWLLSNATLSSYPDEPGRLDGALSNQTTPLFVYTLSPSMDEATTQMPTTEPREVDITGVTLADVCEDIASQLLASNIHYGERHTEFVRIAVVSLATKGLLLLTGLSGSGKTRLGIALGQWFGDGKLRVIAVRPDWTGPDALLGFENGLSDVVDGHHAWNVPEALEFILTAARDPANPYLLLLDEMNLAHVERYFADMLSGMESNEPVVPNLRKREGEWRPAGSALPFPSNLFVIGTVNIDETTYMFSPKVLDRANALEFRVRTEDLEVGTASPEALDAGDPALVTRFLSDATIVADDDWEGRSELADWLSELHELLAEHDREFGHRVFFEALRFGALLNEAGESSTEVALDHQVMQKILPRFHGSARQLAGALDALGNWCHVGPGATLDPSFDPLKVAAEDAALPVSFEKIQRMARRLRANHFVGFAE